MLGWAPLLRRLLRVAVGLGIRAVVRHGRRAARGPRGPDTGDRPTIIDVERVDRGRPFERYSEASRRIVARAAGHHGGTGLTSEALLLATIETDRGSAQELAVAGTDLDALRSHLRDAVASSGRRRGLTPDARRALREAAVRADRRAAGAPVEPPDLMAALLAQDVLLAGAVDRYTLEG